MIKIPAIDIKDGRVVRAYAGNRRDYKPLIVGNKDFSNPESFIKILKSRFNFNNFYIADINSFKSKETNWAVIKKIINSNKENYFWIDAGFSSFNKLNKFKHFVSNDESKNVKLIVGSEFFYNEKNLLNFILQKNLILSIDHKDNRRILLNLAKIKNKEIILMFINKIGGRGISWSVLKKISKTIPTKRCFVAGGIKYSGDIEQLRRLGYKGTIISSIIHKKLT